MLPTLVSLAPTRVLLFGVTRGNWMRQYSAQKQEKLIWSKNGEVRACTPEHTLFPRTGLPYRVSSAGGGSELFVGLGAAVQLCCCRSRSSQRVCTRLPPPRGVTQPPSLCGAAAAILNRGVLCGSQRPLRCGHSHLARVTLVWGAGYKTSTLSTL